MCKSSLGDGNASFGSEVTPLDVVQGQQAGNCGSIILCLQQVDAKVHTLRTLARTLIAPVLLDFAIILPYFSSQALSLHQ